MARVGKIARLPEAVREEVCRRLQAGQLGPQILPWLNALPEVKSVLSEFFDGSAVNAQNLSDWRSGGFREWLDKRDRVHQTRELASYSIKLAQAAGGKISEGASAMLAGQLLEIMEGLRDLRENAEGKIQNEEGSAERLAGIAKAVDSVSRAIAYVRRGDHDAAKLDLDRRKLEQADESLRLERIRLNAILDKAAERLLDETLRQQAASIANSSLSNAEKIAALRKAAFADVDALEASGAVELPK